MATTLASNTRFVLVSYIRTWQRWDGDAAAGLPRGIAPSQRDFSSQGAKRSLL
jgi:hypothetical protein